MKQPSPKSILIAFFTLLATLSFACNRSAQLVGAWQPVPSASALTATSLAALAEGDAPDQGTLGTPPPAPMQTATRKAAAQSPAQAQNADPKNPPTPDAPRPTLTPRAETQQYTVQANDTLGQIARRYGISLKELIDANQISNPNLLSPGQVITIPASGSLPTGSDFKIIPDSELVYGPNAANFDTADFIQKKHGYLSQYSQEVYGDTLTGTQVIVRVAHEYSVNPRLLLAVLEYRSGWVTQATPPDDKSRDYPMLLISAPRKGLYFQMAWAANNLNRGYYLWRAGTLPSWELTDGSVYVAAPTLNAGTAGVQCLFSLLLDENHWTEAVSKTGFYATYTQLFGYPFQYAFEPIHPADLKQPALRLPFEPNIPWYFTGGPHGGWADGSAWAAIDFAPPGDQLGCVQSDAWETAVADGVIVRSDGGAVLEDLDGDGIEQTGWVILYMHVETRDRISAGTVVHTGDRIGHASCEGGVSTGTHLHLARRYNGEWIAADGNLPFNLDGWVSYGEGAEYNGYLRKDGKSIEAAEGRLPENEIIKSP